MGKRGVNGLTACVFACLFAFSTDVVHAEETDGYFIGIKDSSWLEREEIETSYELDVEYEYEELSVVYASMTHEEVAELERSEQIDYIEKDQVVNVEQQEVPWGIEHIGAPSYHSNGFTGEGIDVAVLDTGIQAEHPDLNVVGGESFVYEDPYVDSNGHGTHVAGTIAALDNEYGVVGVAPEANLYAVKVLAGNGSGSLNSIIQGIYWAIENDMDVMNLSLGSSTGSTVMSEAIYAAEEANIVVVAAAGNTGASATGGSTVSYPAAYDSVVAVGATNQSNGRAPFSSVGSELTIMAPGDQIYSTYGADGYQTLSGTSMAAPKVAGFAALLREQNPHASASELRQMMIDTAMPLGEHHEYGHGLMQLEAAFGEIE
ncbi:hypothetical protein DH09_17705 [Bacillaceae bacterium JMAK1]|nr:hypothetical protein DH09_17705 [Bacillaceae bacterium JMAK1]